jgi:hypothetical protein
VRGNQPFGVTPSGGASQTVAGQYGTAQPQIQGGLGQGGFGQGGLGQGGLGQGYGQGGGTPQPSTLFNPNPVDPNSLAAAPVPNNTTNAPPSPANPNVQYPPFGNQPSPSQQPPIGAGQALAQQAANLATGGFNPQAPPSPQNASVGTQPNPALPGNNTNNPALNAIDNTLFRPNQAPAAGASGAPGIAGVASKFKGPSIKAYHEKTKYQEWEFVFEPATNQPGANQPGLNQPGLNQPGANQPGANQPGANQPGANQPGPAGAAGQNPQQNSNPFGPSSGQPAGGAAPSNPFSMPNPFAPSSAAPQ